jgi:hypothetical protein
MSGERRCPNRDGEQCTEDNGQRVQCDCEEADPVDSAVSETKRCHVMCYLNVGKREFGDNHWFWAVWTDVVNCRDWNQEPPSFSGYSPSKSQARRAA